MPAVPSPTSTRALPGHKLVNLPDNRIDLVPAACSIKMYIFHLICLCYSAYLPIACPLIHSNIEFGPSKVILIATIVTDFRHLT